MYGTERRLATAWKGRMKKAIFESIYHTAAWGVGSGKGSDPDYCAAYIQYINELLPQFDTIIDIGVGDWRIGACLMTLGKKYVGVDIVPALVQRLQQDYSAFPFVTFEEADVSRPKALRELLTNCVEGHTLILVKDVLQHWDDKEIKGFLDVLESDFEGTLIAANNWRHFRSPQKPVNPRDVDGNRYHWAPVDLTLKPWKKYHLDPVLYYPRGRYKMVVQRDYGNG